MQSGLPALLTDVVSSPTSAALPDSARVLLLAHGQVLLTRGVLVQLAKALDSMAGATAVHAFDLATCRLRRRTIALCGA